MTDRDQRTLRLLYLKKVYKAFNNESAVSWLQDAILFYVTRHLVLRNGIKRERKSVFNLLYLSK